MGKGEEKNRRIRGDTQRKKNIVVEKAGGYPNLGEY